MAPLGGPETASDALGQVNEEPEPNRGSLPALWGHCPLGNTALLDTAARALRLPRGPKAVMGCLARTPRLHINT